MPRAPYSRPRAARMPRACVPKPVYSPLATRTSAAAATRTRACMARVPLPDASRSLPVASVPQHDVHTLERTYRVPSVAIVSTAFSQQAIFQSEALGHTEAERHIVLAEHPISDACA